MKEKILLFIIGVLVGAVISTGAFFIYSKVSSCNNNKQIGMPGGTPPSMPNNQNGAPERPNSENNQNQQPSEKTNDNNTQNNN